MKILLIYPHYPDTFWSFRHALKFIDRKASFPPLGLLTVAAMLPGQWHKKLVDMNIGPLSDEDLEWADYVFISAMAIQRDSAAEVIVRCRQRGVTTVHGGFIVGFDSDSPATFERQIRFIQESGIVTAMVGVLIALRGTRLYQRLLQEGRLLGTASGNNTAVSLNFIPRMESAALISGYQAILDAIYAPKNYYRRVISLLREYHPPQLGKFHLQPGYLGALFKSILFLGIIGRERFHFWKLFFWSLARRPRQFPLAITYAIYGFHFRKIAEQIGESVNPDKCCNV